VPTLSQVSFTSGEISPSLAMRVDLARYATALRTCRNFFVRPTGGVSNRAGFEYVATLDATSNSLLVPFVFSTEQAYMLVFQEELIQVYADGAFVPSISAPLTITDVTWSFNGTNYTRTVELSGAHSLTIGQQVTIADVIATGAINGDWVVLTIPTAETFTIKSVSSSAAYTSGGTVTYAEPISTDYASEDLAGIRFTQSADVVTLAHSLYQPSEFIRTGASTFTFGAIDDFENGPFLDFNDSATTMTASAALGTGITLTASAAVFNANHIGALVRLDLEDLSGIPPWEASKELAAVGANCLNKQRRSLGKVYRCATDQVAASFPIFTGTVRPAHDEGYEEDGDGNPITDLAIRAGVNWEYLHSLYGIARITAIGGGGTTATADVISYIPVISPATTTTWAFGAWSEDQGYPAVVTYFGDRLVFANTPEQPQTEWASKVSEYHDFGESAPLVDDDAITQTLNARQVNAIVELVPLEQLVALTPSSSWASPQRGELWSPETIGYFPQSHKGAAALRAIEVGDQGAVFAMNGGTKISEIRYAFDTDKYGGDELTVLSRHLFGPDKTIVDMDYSAEPHGILWMVRSDGALIGLTYLPEQQVVGWHRHDTNGFFERVCVIPEDGRDVVYCVIRRTIGGATVRYLERMADREFTDQLDGFFVDCGLTYDGRNTTATTITISGGSYDGGDEVTLTASASLFSLTDVGDAIQFDDVRIIITAFTSVLIVTGELQTPVPVALQATASADWTFARDTFIGLDHLEGEEVTICADGAVLDAQTVSGGSITIDNPAGVVHIGLSYTAEIETLDVTIFGAESIRHRNKIIPEATVVVQDTVGLKIGPDEDHLEELSLRDSEFYTDPTTMTSGALEAYLLNTWNEHGRLLVRQDQPLPATILAVIPKLELGE
jgi:hypothetical protein